ncbi:MAG TPA: DUF167 domain-containing protein [Dongiaceae bacterium]|nr:DUF167 domain-containing protein [Dongiaceae bacterium]
MKLALRVQPGAKRNALLARLASGEWKVAVAAPPSEGRANDAVVELVSDLLGVKRRQVTVARGTSSRSKVLEVEGVSAAEAEARLAAALPAEGPQRERKTDAEHEEHE